MFRQVKRRTAGRRNFEESNNKKLDYDLPKLYSCRLSFYDLPPTREITLEEFEKWAIDRLKILIEIESCNARSKSLKEIESSIRGLLLKYLPLSENQNIEERMKDHYSHYILRLVFCRTEELRKKFIKNETILFKVRYNSLQPREQQEFIELNKYKLSSWEYVTPQEKSELFDKLFASSYLMLKSHFLSGGENLTYDEVKQHVLIKENFIKLPFEKITNLVGTRSIYLHNGYGYLPTSLQLNLLSIEFQENLSLQLMKTFQTIPRLEEDDRLLPLLNNLSKSFSSFKYDTEMDPALISDINATSITSNSISKHFPLCAKHLQNNLIANSHLKYGGRQQLGLFLKGIGLNVDEAIKYWSHQFTKGGSMTVDTFNKEYKYNIRHQYGLEGARINYKPWDCSTILSKPRPNKNEYHGCPYRDFSIDKLVSSLNSMGINDQQELNSIVDDVGRHDYTIACTRVFELTHKSQIKNSQDSHINHPNLYFDRSRLLERGQNKEA
ncbi:unnamed protein product [Candida verbasci]|uniref:DNA primase large subunit n=1 Tax=Candida verbasci TaxID=1227364 RepID=A0A9W4XBD6_9ASCO|nr:unnamed protein product [Candida verbasci]